MDEIFNERLKIDLCVAQSTGHGRHCRGWPDAIREPILRADKSATRWPYGVCYRICVCRWRCAALPRPRHTREAQDMTGPDIYVLYGIPTLFLFVGVLMYAVVRLDSHR